MLFLNSLDNLLKMHLLFFFQKVLIILRKSTKHAYFWLGVQYPLNMRTMGSHLNRLSKTYNSILCQSLVSISIYQEHRRKIFQRGHGHFSWFFSRHEMLFPGRMSILVDSKQISVVWGFKIIKSEKQSKKKKKKKERKKSPLLILKLFYHPLLIFNPFSIFLLFFSMFPFSLDSLFPVGQQKFPGQQKCQGALCPLCSPHASVMPLVSISLTFDAHIYPSTLVWVNKL